MRTHHTPNAIRLRRLAAPIARDGNGESRQPRLGVRAPSLVAVTRATILCAVVLAAACGSSTGAPGGPLPPDGIPPIDPQVIQDQDDMTWDDYTPIPGRNWADPSLVPTQRQFKVALVAVDFEDQPFVGASRHRPRRACTCTLAGPVVRARACVT